MSDDDVEYSRFNDLSVAITLALTGLLVFYLPALIVRPFDWKLEGHLIGLAIALVGAVFIFMAAGKLTDRETFSYWGIALLVGAVVALLVIVLMEVNVPAWLAIVVICAIILLSIFSIYAIVAGFALIFDDRANNGKDGPETSDTETKRNEVSRFGWYERVTLFIAIVSTIATVVATAASLIH